MSGLAALQGWDPLLVEAALAPLVTAGRRQRIEEVLAGRTEDVTVVIEDVNDPHNAAAALRSCEALGLTELHIVEGGEWMPGSPRVNRRILPPARFRPNRKVTQGCERWVDVRMHTSPSTCLRGLAERGYRCLAALPDAPEVIGKTDLSGKVALVIGNEHRGLTLSAVKACQGSYRLPMTGMSRSLNLSVSVALSVYQAVIVSGPRPGLSPTALAELRARWYLEEIDGSEAVVRRYLRDLGFDETKQ